MKKRTLAALALLGISMSLFGQGDVSPDAEQKEFYQLLKPDAQKKFLELDAEHRKAAMEIYHTDCKAASRCGGHREDAVEEQYKNQKDLRERLNKGM